MISIEERMLPVGPVMMRMCVYMRVAFRCMLHLPRGPYCG